MPREGLDDGIELHGNEEVKTSSRKSAVFEAAARLQDMITRQVCRIFSACLAHHWIMFTRQEAHVESEPPLHFVLTVFHVELVGTRATGLGLGLQ